MSLVLGSNLNPTAIWENDSVVFRMKNNEDSDFGLK